MIAFEEEEEGGSGAPAWMATFADLMSLLLCFFVLLLSFSVMDAEKYKQIAGSMKLAFGVQRQIKMEDIPKGTSIIAQEFSPGPTEPTIMETVQQQTQEEEKSDLSVGETEADVDGDAREIEEKVEQLLAETEADAQKLKEVLADEIEKGNVAVDTEGRTITVRISERASFPSGSDRVNAEFLPIMERVSAALGEIRGSITIEGHTDDIPINTPTMRSNWELSAKRALSVAHALLKRGDVDEKRLVISGFADARPRQPNDTPQGRAANRRVEIVIRQPVLDEEGNEVEVSPGVTRFEALNVVDAGAFPATEDTAAPPRATDSAAPPQDPNDSPPPR